MYLYFFDCRPVGWDMAVFWLLQIIQTSFVFKGGKTQIDIEYSLQKEPTQPPKDLNGDQISTQGGKLSKMRTPENIKTTVCRTIIIFFWNLVVWSGF